MCPLLTQPLRGSEDASLSDPSAHPARTQCLAPLPTALLSAQNRRAAPYAPRSPFPRQACAAGGTAAIYTRQILKLPFQPQLLQNF